tara:strand:- start:278 stop:820 length:543 start_codon:yes stop_codon:yes gene_type:complete
MTKYFIEVGSCDFDTLNHLADYGWKGIIIEPVKKFLDNIPRKEGIEYVNVAIDLQDGKRKIHVWPDNITSQPQYRDYRGMSGFNNLPENIDICYELEVDCLCINSLLKKYPVPRIDLLKIDTEGHDFKVLHQFPLSGPLRPKLIKVETQHHNIEVFNNYFKDKSYQIFYEKNDIYAIDLL